MVDGRRIVNEGNSYSVLFTELTGMYHETRELVKLRDIIK